MKSICYLRIGNAIAKVYDRDDDLQCLVTNTDDDSKLSERWKTKHSNWKEQSVNLITDTLQDAGICADDLPDPLWL